MSGMQGVSGAGSMSQSCGMKSMHDSSRVKSQNSIQVEAKRQNPSKDKMPNQLLGSKIDAKA